MSESAKCGNCRFWSQMCARSEGCGPVEALCLSGNSPQGGEYMRETGCCNRWRADHHGKVDDPPNYGEHSRAAYEAEDAEIAQ